MPSSSDNLRALRHRLIAPSVQIFFSKDPLLVVRGQGPYIYNEADQRYLDCINNVSHVGHCHPYVAESTANQLHQLNTNSRYLHRFIITLAEQLAATMPTKSGLDVFFFCNSGSEANDLALRLARTYSGGTENICLDHAYHGHVDSAYVVSPYKFRKETHKDGGAPAHTHVADSTDLFRGRYRLGVDGDERRCGQLYAADVETVLKGISDGGGKVAAFIHEGIQSCAGQIFFPAGYLARVYKAVRQHGGVCIADEIQSGFGRVGHKFWAFQLAGDDVYPDIVTVGKPMGNGFPVSCVITTRAIVDKYHAAGFSYFNTYGGNPVACASALAVLDVLERENLRDNARTVGQYIVEQLRLLQKRHPIIGDVRGVGLFIGFELVRDLKSREPATDEARELIYRAKTQRIILNADGPDENVIKLKPPMCFSHKDADWMLYVIDNVLSSMERDGFSDAAALKEVCRENIPLPLKEASDGHAEDQLEKQWRCWSASVTRSFESGFVSPDSSGASRTNSPLPTKKLSPLVASTEFSLKRMALGCLTGFSFGLLCSYFIVRRRIFA